MKSVNTLYLDFAATSPLLPEVQAAMIETMRSPIGNPAALHQAGHLAKEKLEEAREKVAKLINANPDEIIFTSGGSEANNTVINIFAGQSIAVSAIEHPSVLESAKQRAGRFVMLPVDQYGVVLDADFTDVNLVSVMYANNEIGTIQNVEQLASAAHKAGARFHTDATQVVGKFPLDVKKIDVDYLTFSAHKIGGPVGIGVLYVKAGAPYKSLIFGGAQEKKRRAGTSNILLASGFAAAAEVAMRRLIQYGVRVAKIRDYLAGRILREIPYSHLNGGLAKFEESLKNNEGFDVGKTALPDLLSVSFEAAEGESTQLYLDAANILVSTGSACASGDIKPSHVLMATSGDAEVAHGSIRFSLGSDTTRADIDRAMGVLPGIIKRLQGISTIPVGEKNE